MNFIQNLLSKLHISGKKLLPDDVVRESLKTFQREGLNDYIGFWEITSDVCAALKINDRKADKRQTQQIWQGLHEIIEVLLLNGFEAVSLTDRSGYLIWLDQEPKQVLSIARKMWNENGRTFTAIGFNIWFNKIGVQSKFPTQPDATPCYPGEIRKLPDGSFIGLRKMAKDGTPTIDINVDSLNQKVEKVRYSDHKP